jgi:hypothetical protein
LRVPQKYSENYFAVGIIAVEISRAGRDNYRNSFLVFVTFAGLWPRVLPQSKYAPFLHAGTS